MDGQPSLRGSSTYIMDQSLRVSLSERLWPSTNEGVANRFFEEIEDLPNLIDGLQKHGYKEAEIALILGGNYLRILKTILPEQSVI